MTSPQTVNSYCDKIYKAPSIHEVGVIVQDFPSLIFSKYGIAAIVQVIPKLVAAHNETTFDFGFLRVITTMLQKRQRGLFNAQVLQDQRGNSASTWAVDILKIYVESVYNQSKGECLKPDSIVTKDSSWVANKLCLGSPHHFIGFIVLLFDLQNPNSLGNRIWKKYFMDAAAVHAFFEVFSDCCASLNDQETAINVFADVVRDTLGDPDELFANLMDVNLGWLRNTCDEYLEKCAERSGLETTDIFSDVASLFVHLSNTMKSDFSRETYLYEYMAMISEEYSLQAIRQDIAERYSKYFGDMAILYMADITSTVMSNFGALTNYRENAEVSPAYTNAAKMVEAIIIDIRATYPDVPERVVDLFFKDTLKAFGYGINGASLGIMNSVDAILIALYPRSNATESFSALESIEAISDGRQAAMEADDTGSQTTEDLTKHEKAKIKPKEAMKSAERKIYAGYRKYKDAEDKVDGQLTKGINMVKNAITGDQAAVLIEGKKFSPVGFLKKVLATVAIFNYSKVAFIIGLIVKKTMSRKCKVTERRKIVQQLEEELMMVNEKIEDARGDGNREAKYALMRNKAALENAIKRIKFGIGAEQSREDMNTQVNGYKG